METGVLSTKEQVSHPKMLNFDWTKNLLNAWPNSYSKKDLSQFKDKFQIYPAQVHKLGSNSFSTKRKIQNQKDCEMIPMSSPITHKASKKVAQASNESQVLAVQKQIPIKGPHPGTT